MKTPAPTNSARGSPWTLPFRGPWLLLRYRPTSLWSLKLSQATSSGGKTLLVPTPYSFKLGLIDAAIQMGQIVNGERLFELLKGRPLRICPPARAVVTAALLKIQKLGRGPLEGSVFSSTVGFREYVQFTGEDRDGEFQVAIASSDIDQKGRQLLSRAAAACSYSGKRGCFLTFIPTGTQDGLEEVATIAPDAPFTLPSSVWQSAGSEIQLGTVQPLDELSAEAEWNNVNTFGDGAVTSLFETDIGSDARRRADRVFVHTFVPYRLVGSARGYAHYQRIDRARSSVV